MGVGRRSLLHADLHEAIAICDPLVNGALTFGRQFGNWVLGGNHDGEDTKKEEFPGNWEPEVAGVSGEWVGILLLECRECTYILDSSTTLLPYSTR